MLRRSDGAIEGLHHLLKSYTVFILSTRDPQQIADWLHQWSDLRLRFEIIGPDIRFWNKPDVIGITNRKLPAQVYIDDRAYLFRDWTDLKIASDSFNTYPKGL